MNKDNRAQAVNLYEYEPREEGSVVTPHLSLVVV